VRALVDEGTEMMSEHRCTNAKATNPPAKLNRNALSFREVYEAYFRFARRTLRRLGVPDADLMDMTQNVFVVVHRKLPRFEGRSKLSTWLHGICLRIASDYRRSARSRREELVDYHVIEKFAGRSVATSAPDKPSIVAFVESALHRLPANQRIVFLLFADNVRGVDIAALLDIPEGTVRSRLRLARETLRHEAARLKRLGAKRSGVPVVVRPVVWTK
jgi:RNA polymerase sigma-70 factor (ECF subfamily)